MEESGNPISLGLTSKTSWSKDLLDLKLASEVSWSRLKPFNLLNCTLLEVIKALLDTVGS